ncbi:MAG TPA: sigma-70 family RNA polymerase sigma factor [Propionibacteriaceae bacterium]|nr:sigma-70 family RNA polymerase sigma factor [Propionibacteriaceae bacterium]
MSSAVATSDATFLELTEPLRRELTAHCYRMLGSVHDAEDLVQETYLRAWRSFHGFENRSSVRTWMYQIATNVCLTALQSRSRRPLPTGLGQPSSDPQGLLESKPDASWLEPIPDSVLWGNGGDGDPAAEVVTRESVRLAFVAALQHLTPQQRAVVIFRDVLAWRASEVAGALGMTTAGVNSTLQRARAQLARLAPDTASAPLDSDRARRLLDNYVAAFEDYDVSRIVELLRADVVWEMPPFTGWYVGAEAIGRLIATQCPADGPGAMRLVPTAANGQPAFAVYMRGADGRHRPFQIQQLTLTADGVSHVAAYFDLSLFRTFGLPEVL